MISNHHYQVKTLFARAFSTLKSRIPPANLYEEHFKLASSQDTMQDFWKEQAKAVEWYKFPTNILDSSNTPFYKWFADGCMNTSYNCLDRHLPALANKVAIYYESPVTNTSMTMTFRELKELVARFAGVLERHGVKKGDRVVIYMPMIPEAVAAMLASSRIGAIHSVVFGGFAAKELASRIQDANPKLIVSASCGIEPSRIVNYKEILDEAIKIAKVEGLKKIIVQRPQHTVKMKKGEDFDYYDEVSTAEEVSPVPVLSTDPLYILYTSGTTGSPKGVVRDNGGNAVVLTYSMKYIMGVERGETYFSTSDIGWVVGHSFIVYAPLLNGSATVLFEGKAVGTPDAGIIWRLTQKHKVKAIFTSPTALRSLRREDHSGEHIKVADLSHLSHFALGGERLDIPTAQWIQDLLPKHCLLNDNYWQTESGWPISSNYTGLHRFPVKLGSATKPVPGYRVSVFDESGHSVIGKPGKVFIKLPTPPSFMSTLYNNDEAFVNKYLKELPGYYFTGDAGYLDEEGYLHITARTDDIINTAGHRLSTSQIEEVLMGDKNIAEAAVVGMKDELKGEVPIGFVVLQKGVNTAYDVIEKTLIKRVREEIGPVASFKFCVVLEKMPKTRSGKSLRNVLRSLANGETPRIPPTIEDDSVIEGVKKHIKEHGLGQKPSIYYEEDISKKDVKK